MALKFEQINVSGKSFGKWTATDKFKIEKGSYFWLCKCLCGSEKFVNRRSLVRGLSKSCGKCREKIHKLSGTKIYKLWEAMMRRVYSKKHKHYQDYGGRGITVCKEWHDFENFYKDIGIYRVGNLSLDRIDNNGNYCKENCRWSTQKEQTNNTRKNRKVIYNGNEYNLCQLSEKLGIKYTTLKRRLDLGRSLDAPVR